MTNVISSSAAANANILFIGDAFGAIQADGSGDYTITVDAGSYD
jgi:uracil-DNA glycosylase